MYVRRRLLLRQLLGHQSSCQFVLPSTCSRRSLPASKHQQVMFVHSRAKFMFKTHTVLIRRIIRHQCTSRPTALTLHKNLQRKGAKNTYWRVSSYETGPYKRNHKTVRTSRANSLPATSLDLELWSFVLEVFPPVACRVINSPDTRTDVRENKLSPRSDVRQNTLG